MNEVGYVLWHSLNESGHVAIYDVEWPDGTIETDGFSGWKEIHLRCGEFLFTEQPDEEELEDYDILTSEEYHQKWDEQDDEDEEDDEDDESKEHSLPEEVMDDEEILAAKLEQERLEKERVEKIKENILLKEKECEILKKSISKLENEIENLKKELE